MFKGAIQKKTAKPDYQKSNFADECYFLIAETAEYIYCHVNNNLSYFSVSETINVSSPHLSSVVSHLT